jgi:hypothetical protein
MNFVDLNNHLIHNKQNAHRRSSVAPLPLVSSSPIETDQKKSRSSKKKKDRRRKSFHEQQDKKIEQPFPLPPHFRKRVKSVVTLPPNFEEEHKKTQKYLQKRPPKLKESSNPPIVPPPKSQKFSESSTQNRVTQIEKRTTPRDIIPPTPIPPTPTPPISPFTNSDQRSPNKQLQDEAVIASNFFKDLVKSPAFQLRD